MSGPDWRWSRKAQRDVPAFVGSGPVVAFESASGFPFDIPVEIQPSFILAVVAFRDGVQKERPPRKMEARGIDGLLVACSRLSRREPMMGRTAI